jgi:glycopeptide antibiotics resistance protein
MVVKVVVMVMMMMMKKKKKKKKMMMMMMMMMMMVVVVVLVVMVMQASALAGSVAWDVSMDLALPLLVLQPSILEPCMRVLIERWGTR